MKNEYATLKRVTHRKAAFVLAALERREKDFLQQRDDAVKRQAWSQVAGFDGISIGLQYAQGILRAEFQRKRRS